MRALITSPVMKSFEKVIVAIKVIKANKPLSKAIVAPKASKAIIANTFKPGMSETRFGSSRPRPRLKMSESQ